MLNTNTAAVIFAHNHPSGDTQPSEATLERIRGIRPEGGRSNSAAGMERSIYELRTQGRPGADRAIILITDTYIHTGDRSRDLDFERWLRDAMSP